MIAEPLYKVHSFILECSAFLAKWFVLDVLRHVLRSIVTKNRSHTHVVHGSTGNSPN